MATASRTASTWRVGIIALCVACMAAEHNNKLDIGDAAPDWKNVLGTDDETHQLNDYKGKKFVVAVFTCNTCPIAIDYEDRLIALQDEYGEKGVQLIAINVNTNNGNQFKDMKKRAAEKQFNFPYLFDKTQRSARNYGATVTPHVFVLDEKRNIAYMGAVDDHRNEAKVTKNHLRDALDALLAGKAPTAPETRQFGCGIEFVQ